MKLYYCSGCKIDYPENLLSAFLEGTIGGGPPKSTLVCGICALEMSNKAHGDNRTKFDGRRAEKMRQGALQWRKDHPTDKETSNET